MERLRSLSEDECYLRCYGSVLYRRRGSDDRVRLVPKSAPATREPRREEPAAGERLPALLERRLGARESFEAA